MIKLKNFYITEEDGKSRLIQPVEVDGNNFDVYVEVESQHQKYFVTDRADAILIGIVHMAMRQNHDIYSELPITGELLYNLNNILIPMLTKYDPTLTKIKINASPINEPVQNFGGVGTGLSLGVDGLTTISQYHNHPIENMRLTHFLTFNDGVFGGYFQESGWDLQARLIYQKQLQLIQDIGLPLIMINTNLHNLVRLKGDLWVNYCSAYNFFCLGKLFQKYYFSSTGWDYSQFTLYPTGNNFDSDQYNLLFNATVNTKNNLTVLSGGGELNRFEKMEIISKNPLAHKYLHSCLTQAFNCGVCIKCRRNLLALDALNCLDKFTTTYDIQQYRQNREEYLYTLIANYIDKTLSYEHYYQEVYQILQAREPELFEKIEKQLTTGKVLELKKANKNLQTRLNTVTAAAKSPLFIEHIKHFFATNNYKSVILYGNNELAALLITHQKQLQIKISHIVENTKIKKHAIPRLPIRTVDYPPTDAVIICAINDVQVIVKKLQQRINCPIHLATEIFAHTSPYAKFSDEQAKIAELSTVLQKRDSRIEQLKTTVDGKNSRIEQLKTTVDGKNSRIENLKTTVDNKNIRIEQLKSTIDSNNAQSTAQIQNLNTTISQKDEEIEHLKTRISALETSTSWQITQPLRTFKQKIVPSPA
ncbi:MAG: ELKS/Rab6-interacting/CAST family protein [Firmicutes bacterium]|nr:ELKS/Rab6-interacting/CAST family protein [Bacillota bacterium]